MMDTITSAITAYFTQLWQNIWYYASFSFLDPFWGWLAFGVVSIAVITAVEMMIRFYFADIPRLRKIGGLAVIGIVWGLFAYRRGEREARAHDEAAKPKREEPTEDSNPNPWRPFW